MSIAKYSFLPWLRQGLSQNITLDDQTTMAGPLKSKSEATVRYRVEGVPVGQNQYVTVRDGLEQIVQMVGPGEIVGIQQRAIVKEEPRAGITDFEPNFLSYIEFYEEDFPFRYSPARADGGRLRPWIILVVLEAQEFQPINMPGFLLPAFQIQGDPELLFPDKTQLWAWAHVHVNRELLPTLSGDEFDNGRQAAAALRQLVKTAPNQASSRIICPRKLKPNTAYQAFLIPTFEQGRLAGLGASQTDITKIDVRQCSWDGYTNRLHADIWPYYHTWYFRTGDKLDFEYLVRLIEPRDLSVIAPELGRRPMDLQKSGYLLNYSDNDGAVLLEGALQLPAASRDDFLDTKNNVHKRGYVEQLRDAINLSEEWREDPAPVSYSQLKDQLFAEASERQTDDPIVVAPLYGQWHLGVKKVTFDANPADPTVEAAQKAHWFNQLNLDPRYRVAAGLGTATIQQTQEEYMDRAWDQVGKVYEAVRRLRLGQFSAETSFRLYQNYFVPFQNQPTYSLMSLVSMVQSHIRQPSIGNTIWGAIQNSNISSPLINQLINKISRPFGSLFNRISFTPRTTLANSLIRDNADVFDFPDFMATGGQMFTIQTVDTLVEDAATGQTRSRSVRRLFNGVPWPGLDAAMLQTLTDDDGGTMQARGGETDELEVLLAPLIDYFSDSNWNRRSEPQPFMVLFETDPNGLIINELNPRVVVNRSVLQGINFGLQESDFTLRSGAIVLPGRIVEPLAYPEFPDPMYLHLRDKSSELLLPGIDKIPENTFSILQTNRHFIESYMVGLNHEMARELLWREYPTDQRGSYFRKFWENTDNLGATAQDADIKPITDWCVKTPVPGGVRITPTPLGKNHPNPAATDDQLVFVVRGYLLKKFPNTLVYLQRGRWVTEMQAGVEIVIGRTFDQAAPIISPVFQAKAEPDITFLGFPIGIDEALGFVPTNANPKPIPTDDPGYFVVVRERPGEPRFGLDIPTDEVSPKFQDVDEWNSLHWHHLRVADGEYIDLNALYFGENSASINVQDLNALAANKGADRLFLEKVVESNLPLPPPGESPLEEETMLWGKNAAHMAGIFLQLPFMVAIHAAEMVTTPAP